MALKEITHNKKAISYLDAYIKQEKSAGALFFYGVDLVLLEAFALEFAKALNCRVSNGCDQCSSCLEIDKKIFPDLYFYEARQGIDQLRNLLGKVYHSSNNGNKKVILIQNTGKLTTIEANSLLKIIEEPPKETFFILLSKNKKILPTLFSRVVAVNFLPISQKESQLSKEAYGLRHKNLTEIFPKPIEESEKQSYKTLSEHIDALEGAQTGLNLKVYSAIQDYVEQKRMLTEFDKIAFALSLEKSLKNNKTYTAPILKAFIYNDRSHRDIEDLIDIASTVGVSTTLKIGLIIFFIKF